MARRLCTPSLPGRSSLIRITAVGTLLAVLAGCGSSVKASSAAVEPLANAPSGVTASCPATALEVYKRVLHRVYREGVSSEQTIVAKRLIGRSDSLRAAVERGDASGARAAVKELIATKHMTHLKIIRNGRTFVDVGGSALTPLHGTLSGASGAPLATYLTSVWSDHGFVDEANGIVEGLTALRQSGRSIGGSLELPPGELANEGTLTYKGLVYQYTSLPARAFPSGSLRIYILKRLDSISALCGAGSEEDTVANVLSHIANRIYAAEGGPRTIPQVHRVQRNQALLQAVARRDSAATRAAIFTLLNQHIVRLRVSDSKKKLISDVGGPYVLAPVSAPLSLNGRTIGSFVLSLQDDEGYLRLTKRLANLSVLMYMNPNSSHPRLVKNSLGPSPRNVPASGHYSYHGKTFRVFTVNAEAFPSGPLMIRVLIPLPYS